MMKAAYDISIKMIGRKNILTSMKLIFRCQILMIYLSNLRDYSTNEIYGDKA